MVRRTQRTFVGVARAGSQVRGKELRGKGADRRLPGRRGRLAQNEIKVIVPGLTLYRIRLVPDEELHEYERHEPPTVEPGEVIFVDGIRCRVLEVQPERRDSPFDETLVCEAVDG